MCKISQSTILIHLDASLCYDEIKEKFGVSYYIVTRKNGKYTRINYKKNPLKYSYKKKQTVCAIVQKQLY